MYEVHPKSNANKKRTVTVSRVIFWGISQASIADLITLLFRPLQNSPPSQSPPLSEFCTDEDDSVIRSAIDVLRYSKK
jgi:hypothetical protein